MTLSLGGELRYTANAKSPAFYRPGVLRLWRWYHHRCLNSGKKRSKHSPANSAWLLCCAGLNNAMPRCARSHDHGREGAYVGMLPARTASFCIRSRHHSTDYLSFYLYACQALPIRQPVR